MAAFEYEVRLWDAAGKPASSGISYSLVEIGRYDEFLESSVRPSRASASSSPPSTPKRARACSS